MCPISTLESCKGVSARQSLDGRKDRLSPHWNHVNFFKCARRKKKLTWLTNAYIYDKDCERSEIKFQICNSQHSTPLALQFFIKIGEGWHFEHVLGAHREDKLCHDVEKSQAPFRRHSIFNSWPFEISWKK